MATLKIPPGKAVLLLKEKVEEIERMMGEGKVLEYYDFVGWCSKVWSTIDQIYGAGEPHPEEIRMIGVPRCSCTGSVEVQRMLLSEYHSRLLQYIDEIQGSTAVPGAMNQ